MRLQQNPAYFVFAVEVFFVLRGFRGGGRRNKKGFEADQRFYRVGDRSFGPRQGLVWPYYTKGAVGGGQSRGQTAVSYSLHLFENNWSVFCLTSLL